MKVTCTRKELYFGVQTVSRAIPGRSSWPILNNILVRTEEGALRLTAFDMELGIECVIPATIIDEGELTVPAKYLIELLSIFSESSDIAITSDDQYSIQIKCDKSDYMLLGLPPEEFRHLPEISDANSFEIAQSDLKDIIHQTIYAVSTDESRAILTGIHMKLSGKTLKFAATDTHRLAIKTAAASEASGEAECIIPKRALDEVSRLLETNRSPVDEDNPESPVLVSIADSQIKFFINGIVIVSRLIEGQFPNYERIIPTEYERKLTIPAESFLLSVKRASILARENNNRVTIKTEGDQLIVTAESGEVGKAYEELEIVKEGDDIEIVFNVKYLLDFLNAVGSDGIFFEMKGPLETAVIKPVGKDDYLYVIMPMHLV